jgi:hypothetical protein
MNHPFFRTNPEKAASLVAINSFMMGSLFIVFTLIWTLNPKQFSILIIAQLAFAIPLLFVSSLAYTKVGYKKEVKHWETFGWYTNTIGNAFLMNSMGLVIAKEYPELSFAYFFLIIILMLIYSVINISLNHERAKEKLFKFLFLVAIIVLLGILPVIL